VDDDLRKMGVKRRIKAMDRTEWRKNVRQPKFKNCTAME
jgi:hypothetical protein